MTVAHDPVTHTAATSTSTGTTSGGSSKATTKKGASSSGGGDDDGISSSGGKSKGKAAAVATAASSVPRSKDNSSSSSSSSSSSKKNSGEKGSTEVKKKEKGVSFKTEPEGGGDVTMLLDHATTEEVEGTKGLDKEKDEDQELLVLKLVSASGAAAATTAAAGKHEVNHEALKAAEKKQKALSALVLPSPPYVNSRPDGTPITTTGTSSGGTSKILTKSREHKSSSVASLSCEQIIAILSAIDTPMGHMSSHVKEKCCKKIREKNGKIEVPVWSKEGHHEVIIPELPSLPSSLPFFLPYS